MSSSGAGRDDGRAAAGRAEHEDAHDPASAARLADEQARTSRRRRDESRGGIVAWTWRRLNGEQRLAAVAAVLVIVSTFGPFSFTEAAEILTAGAVLALLKLRADRREFHLPLGDGTVIAAAGLWCAVLMATRLFERPVGQSVLALSCALLLTAAGLRERVKRPADDLPAPLETLVASVSPTPERPAESPPPASGDL